MSTDRDDDLTAAGVPELTPLGKRIELLRFERRMSKRILAHRAGTSRQQLWRVMTGKSELTSSLCARLADVLETDSRLLRDTSIERSENRHLFARPSVDHTVGAPVAARRTDAAVHNVEDPDGHLPHRHSLEEYVTRPDGLSRTFDTLPATRDGRRLKRVLLDAIEDIAISRSLKLPQTIFDLRRAVVNDDDA